MASTQKSPAIRYGLRIWNKNTSKRQRFRKISFLIFCMIATLAVAFPFVEPISTPYPLVAGLPFSFLWMLGWLFLMYSALYIYHKTEQF